MQFDRLSVHEKTETVKFEAGAIASIKHSDIRRHGVRRFEGGKIYQCSRLGEASLARLLEDTKEWGGPGIAHDFGFAPAHVESRSGEVASSTTREEFESASLELAARYPQFVFTGSCAIKHSVTSLTSSYGLELQATGGTCDWYLMYQRKGSGNMFDGFVTSEGVRPDISNELLTHGAFLQAQLHEASLPPGRSPVLLVDTLAPVKKLQESLQVHRYFEGSCLYAGRLNEQLFAQTVTLIDAGYAPKNGRVDFFDGEGTVRPNDDHILIENGVFKNLMSDRRFGQKFNYPSTGNGLRNYKSGVGLGPRGLMFAPGNKSWREIVKGLDRCVVAVIAAGGDSNDLGEFSTPVQIAYVYEKGELIGRAPQFSLKIALNDYLGKNLIDVASDQFMTGTPGGAVIAEMDILLN